MSQSPYGRYCRRIDTSVFQRYFSLTINETKLISHGCYVKTHGSLHLSRTSVLTICQHCTQPTTTIEREGGLTRLYWVPRIKGAIHCVMCFQRQNLDRPPLTSIPLPHPKKKKRKSKRNWRIRQGARADGMFQGPPLLKEIETGRERRQSRGQCRQNANTTTVRSVNNDIGGGRNSDRYCQNIVTSSSAKAAKQPRGRYLA